jgi:hypothetical protein
MKIKISKKIIIITTLTIPFILLVFCWPFLSSYRNVIFQEGNPLPIFVGICKLHMQGEDIVQISDKPQKRYVMRSSMIGGKYLEDILSKQGWTKVEQWGALSSFKKGNKEIGVTSRMYTGMYIILIWDEY